MAKKALLIPAAALALGIIGSSVTPVFADADTTTSWNEVRVTTAQELTLTGNQSSSTLLEPTASGGADTKAAGGIGVRANVAWKIQWLAVTGALGAESLVAAADTDLTASGFGAAVTNASLSYQGTDAAATGANVWSAQLAVTGTNTTKTFNALDTSATTIVTGTATENGLLVPTYSADIDATLTNGSYYGTIYYKLSTN